MNQDLRRMAEEALSKCVKFPTLDKGVLVNIDAAVEAIAAALAKLAQQEPVNTAQPAAVPQSQPLPKHYEFFVHLGDRIQEVEIHSVVLKGETLSIVAYPPKDRSDSPSPAPTVPNAAKPETRGDRTPLLETLAEIFADTEAPHKVSVTHDGCKNVTVVYTNMDEQWLAELIEAGATTWAAKLETQGERAELIASRLQSLLDRMANDAYAGSMFEGDGDALRSAIDFIKRANKAALLSAPVHVEPLTEERKDYLRRLVSGVRRQIDQDPETIKAREECGDGCLIGTWIDASLLCLVVEKDVLRLPEYSIGKDKACS